MSSAYWAYLSSLGNPRVAIEYGRIAAAYFERSFQWHPTTHLDSRLRAARLYDKVLNEQSHAIQLYTEVTTHETDPKRLQEAQQRLAELNGKAK